MKRGLAGLLILLLALSLFACGNGDGAGSDGSTDGTGTGGTSQGGAAGSDGNDGSSDSDSDGSGSGEADDPSGAAGAGTEDQTQDPNEIFTVQDDEGREAYQFKASIAEDFGLSDVVAKVDYSDFEKLASTMENKLDAAAERELGGVYETFGEYEPDEESDMDELSYAMAMENDDIEARYLEGGVYHDKNTGNFQYLVLFSENFGDATDAAAQSAAELMKTGMGVTLPAKQLKAAIQKALDKANEIKDFYGLEETTIRNGNGYVEKVTIHVDGMVFEDEEPATCYVSVERERQYR